MASAIRESVYGPNNRVIGAQFQTTLYYEHNFATATPFSGRYPWRPYKGLSSIPSRSTTYKITYFSGQVQTGTFQNQIVFGPNDAMARRTTLGTPETSLYYPRQGGLTEFVENQSNPRSPLSGPTPKPDPRITAAFGTAFPNSQVQNLYQARGQWTAQAAVFRKYVVSFLETAKQKNLDSLLRPNFLLPYRALSNMPPAPDCPKDVHHNFAFPVSVAERPSSLASSRGEGETGDAVSTITRVPPTIAADQDGHLHAYDTTGAVTDTEVGLFYRFAYAVPVTQNPSGMMGSTVYGEMYPVMVSPKIVNGARKWYLLFQMYGVYEDEPIYKYYQGLRYAAQQVGSVALQSGGFGNTEMSNPRAAISDGFSLSNGVTFSQLMSKYPYAAQDSDLAKATTRFCDNWDFSVAGEWTVGHMSLHQFWSIPIDEVFSVNPSITPTVTEIGEMSSKTLTISFSGLSNTTVVTEAPKQTWQKGKAYRSAHLARKSATTIVHTVVEYFVVDAYVKQGESQKTFLGFIAYRSLRFDKKGDTCVSNVGKINRWLSASTYLNARHFDGLSLLPPAHAEAALRPIPHSWVSHSVATEDYGGGESYVRFSRTLVNAGRYSNYLFRYTHAGVVGQAYTVTHSNAELEDTFEGGNSLVSGAYFSHRYYLDGDELKVQAPYLPSPLTWSYDYASGPSANYLTQTGVTTLPSIAVVGLDGSLSWVSCISSFLSINTSTKTITASAGTKTYSAPLFKVQDFKIEPDPSLTVLTGRNGRAEAQPQVLKLGTSTLGLLTTRTYGFWVPTNSPSPVDYEGIAGAVSDTFGDTNFFYITYRYNKTVSGIYRALSTGYYDTSTSSNYYDRQIGGFFDISPYNDIYQNYSQNWFPQNFTGSQAPWTMSSDAPPAFPVAFSFGQNWPIVTTNNYTLTLVTGSYQYYISGSGFFLWPIAEEEANKDYAPPVIDHGIYCHYEYPNNNKYAVIYWKPGMDIAWRIANPFLLDGSKMPSLAEIEALVSQDAAALDAHYSFFTADQTTMYNQAVAAYNAQSGHPSFTKFQKPPSQYPIQYATKRTTEWAAVKAELLNLKTVWTNTKLASEGGDDTDKDNKIALRKTAADKLWKAARVIVFNNFLSESFFLKHPVKDRTCVVEDKVIVDQLRA